MASKNVPERREAPALTQQIVSLLIAIHLLVMALTLSSYNGRSALQDRLLAIFAPYTRTLNFAPHLAPFHLTQYDARTGEGVLDDEHYIELEVTRDGQSQRVKLHQYGLNVPESKQRFRTFAAQMAGFAAEGGPSDTEAAELARSAAGFALRRLGTDVGVLRLQHHLSQPRLLAQLREGYPTDPTDPRYVVTVYEADVLLDDDGQVQIIKREAAGQVAPVTSSGTAPANAP